MKFLKESSYCDEQTGNGLRVRRAIVRWLSKRGHGADIISMATQMSDATVAKHLLFQHGDEPPTQAQSDTIKAFYDAATMGMPRQAKPYRAFCEMGLIKAGEMPATKERASEILSLLHHADVDRLHAVLGVAEDGASIVSSTERHLSEQCITDMAVGAVHRLCGHPIKDVVADCPFPKKSREGDIWTATARNAHAQLKGSKPKIVNTGTPR